MLYCRCNTCYINIVFESEGEQMSEYDPKHAESFDSVEYVKVVMFVMEYFQGLFGVKRLDHFRCCAMFLFFLEDSSPYKSEDYH